MKKLTLFAVLLIYSLPALAFTGSINSPGSMATSQQSDGKLIIGGHIVGDDGKNTAALERVDANNDTDTSYGTNGIVKIPVGTESMVGLVESLDNDKVKVTGFAYSVEGLAQPDLEFTSQMNSDGTLDSGYGDNGIEVSKI